MLEKDEIAALVARLGQKLSPKELLAAMAAMDDDGSGEVDFDEFYSWFGSDKASVYKQQQAQNDNDLFEIVPFADM